MTGVKTYVRGALHRISPEALPILRAARAIRARRKAPFVETRHGFRMRGNATMAHGAFEPEETVFLDSALRDADVFVDIGANIGYYSCLARARGVEVVAIEPLPENLVYLYDNLSVNGWSDTEVFPVGLAPRPGLMHFYGGNTGASLVQNWAGASAAWHQTIAVSTLDRVLGRRFHDRKLLIKIDVEGGELGVLQGAREILEMRPRPVWFVEICFTENIPSGINPCFREIFELFWGCGYSASSISADGSRVVTRDDVDRWLSQGRRDFGYVNFAFRGTDPA